MGQKSGVQRAIPVHQQHKSPVSPARPSYCWWCTYSDEFVYTPLMPAAGLPMGKLSLSQLPILPVELSGLSACALLAIAGNAAPHPAE